MTTIDLDQVMGEVLTHTSRNLVTRPTGAAVRDRVIFQLREGMDEVALDFSRIGVVDYSCADEVVAKLLTLLEGLPISRIRLTGVHPHHAEAIGHALERQSLLVPAILAETGCQCLLGAVSGDLQAVYLTLSELGRATARSLADRLDWTVIRTEAALSLLLHSNCVVLSADSWYQTGSE